MSIKRLLALLLLPLALTSCFEDDPKKDPLKPVTPTDEVINKNHDDPKRIELILFECHFHGNKVHASPEIIGSKYLKKEQVMVYEEVPGEGWKINPEKGVDRFVVVGGGVEHPKEAIDPAKRDWTDKSFNAQSDAGLALRPYGLIIKMYNKDGEEITGQFATNGEDQRHQFFFTAKDIRPTTYGDPAIKGKYPDGDYHYMYYYYFDTDPWDRTLHDKPAAKYTGISNPIGLKGFMEFIVPNSRFELQLVLLHARASKFSGEEGRPSPFYSMSKKQRATDVTDINLSGISFVVFADANDYLEKEDIDPEHVTKEDLGSLSEEDRLFVDKLVDAYDDTITPEEALRELWLIPNGDSPDHDSSQGRYL